MELSIQEKIKNYAQEIFDELGSGFSESIYHEAFKVCLIENNIVFSTETVIPIIFRERQIGFIRADLVVHEEPKYVIELKAVANAFKESEINQLRNYLIRTNIEFGFLINFPQSNTKKRKDSIDILLITKDTNLDLSD